MESEFCCEGQRINRRGMGCMYPNSDEEFTTMLVTACECCIPNTE
jgi:hypothetical protein